MNQSYRGQPLLAADQPAEEPLLTTGATTAIITALLAVLVAAGVPLSDELRLAILGLVAVTAPLVVAWVGRRKVFAPATVKRLIAERPAPR